MRGLFLPGERKRISVHWFFGRCFFRGKAVGFAPPAQLNKRSLEGLGSAGSLPKASAFRKDGFRVSLANGLQNQFKPSGTHLLTTKLTQKNTYAPEGLSSRAVIWQAPPRWARNPESGSPKGGQKRLENGRLRRNVGMCQNRPWTLLTLLALRWVSVRK